MQDRPMVLVAGSTGYLGRHVVRALAREGYRVRALVRDPDRLGDIADLCAEVFVAEATRPETLDGLVGDATVVFSALGKRDFKRRPTLWEVDHDANINIVRRARDAGVEHFVFISALNADVLAAQGVEMARAREGVVQALQESDMDWTVLRPTGFFNDMADFFNMAAKGTGWLIGDGTLRINPIHGADLAAEVVRHIGDPASRNQAFSLGGPDVLTYREILELAFSALGRPPKYRTLPLWTVRAAAPVVGLFNPMVGGLLQAILGMVELDAVAPRVGTHHLADHFAELAGTPAGEAPDRPEGPPEGS